MKFTIAPVLHSCHFEYYYGSMFRLSIKIAALLAAITSTSGQTERKDKPETDQGGKNTILMFGASWCAPCIAELRDIATLASAAMPNRIQIVWTDNGINRYKIALPSNVEMASGAEVFEATRFISNVPGLPYSVVLDGQRRICAAWNGKLTPEAIRRMLADCAELPRSESE